MGMNNFQYVFSMTEVMGISVHSVYCVFTPKLFKKVDYLIITNYFRNGKWGWVEKMTEFLSWFIR